MRGDVEGVLGAELQPALHGPPLLRVGIEPLDRAPGVAAENGMRSSCRNRFSMFSCKSSD
jgi:hypothetical protein